MWQTLVDQLAAQYGIPPELARSLVSAESGWKQDAVSPAGAIGLTQLMPATAKELGVDPYDPAQNIKGGMQYLGQQYKDFGSWPLALAAYNAGPGNVRKYGGIPPFAETQSYVNKVLGGAPALQVAQAGRSDVPQGLMPREMPTMSGQQQQQAPMPPQMGGQPPAPMGFGDRLGAAMSNPAFLMGASILANNVGNYGSAAPAIGRGMQQGAALYSGGQEETTQNDLRKMQMDVARRRMAQEEQDAAYVEEFVSRLDPAQQRLARAIGVPKYVELLRGGKPPAAYEEFQLGLQNPEFRKYQEEMKRAGSPNVNVAVGGDKKYVEKRGELDATAMGQLQTAANGAYRANLSLQRILNTSDTAAAGGAAMLQTGLKNFLASFGYTDKELQNSQNLIQAVAEIKAGKMAELGARGLTDKDMEILTQSLPRLDSDPSARKSIASILMKANDMTIGEYADAITWEDEQYPEQKFRRPTWLKTWKPSGLMPGAVEDGYRFKGGNPGDPNNWEKQ